ncbi:MAG: HAMP domain-containing sensor histidine kinase [Muricomes sp.]|uniref:sensor histidine kinase n=1 Tax=Faecalicatena contorta TaxID=39482 RepID=UPI002EC2210D|nr:HAMP domain-containing sensor histidine kinase [Muricomes sp.]
MYFPVNITKVTMFLNGDRFTTGKTIFALGTGVLIMILLAGGLIYGFWITNKMNHISECVRSISKRDYTPLIVKGSFGDVYESLNQLDQDIRDTDSLKEQTESMREEWIANITHDLKTPLSPIKGYAEILFENGSVTGPQLHKYSGVILKNVSSIERLIEDLKLTYQLESGMLPVQSRRQDFVRFMKELVIDILNNPAYENRVIHFESDQEPIYFLFDEKLMARAFQNLILNSFTHGNRDTEVDLEITTPDRILTIVVSDNGPGMNPSELSMLFQRYYRGASSGQKTEGTGLGLAIAKSIVETQGGRICADSEIHAGTSFKIEFPTMV